MRLAILADDLTGACDAAAPFAARGLATEVVLQPPAPSLMFRDDIAVLAIDADSRRVGRAAAVARTAAAARAARASGATALFKKIDSTLRGHVAAELGACRRAWDAPLVLLCPAFPSMGRRVEIGRLHVDGRGDVGGVAELAGLRPTQVAHLSVDLVDGGVGDVVAALSQHQLAGIRVVVADATLPSHLAVLVEAAGRLDPPPLLAGSAGLAGVLAGRVVSGTRPADRWPLTTDHSGGHSQPWLVVAGSQTEATAAQVAELEQAGAKMIALELGDLLTRRRLAETAGARAARVLDDGRTPILQLVVGPDASAIASPRIEDRAAGALGRACRVAVERAAPGGLFLTGGLTARACLRRLDVHALRLVAEPLPGVAESRAVGGTWDGGRVITKAGGFGAPDAIRRLVIQQA